MTAPREKLPTTRRSVTHRFTIYYKQNICPNCSEKVDSGECKVHFTVGLYEDGRPGELFITVDKAEPAVRGFAENWAIAVSLCLQAGVPFESLLGKFSHQRFEPRGKTDQKGHDFGYAKSIPDYIIRWIDVNVPRPVTQPDASDDASSSESVPG